MGDLPCRITNSFEGVQVFPNNHYAGEWILCVQFAGCSKSSGSLLLVPACKQCSWRWPSKARRFMPLRVPLSLLVGRV